MKCKEQEYRHLHFQVSVTSSIPYIPLIVILTPFPTSHGCTCVQVSLGVHHHSRRRVAIKVVEKSRLVDPNEAKRMQREIRVMRHLTHPCIVKLFEVSKGGREWGMYREVG